MAALAPARVAVALFLVSLALSACSGGGAPAPSGGTGGTDEGGPTIPTAPTNVAGRWSFPQGDLAAVPEACPVQPTTLACLLQDDPSNVMPIDIVQTGNHFSTAETAPGTPYAYFCGSDSGPTGFWSVEGLVDGSSFELTLTLTDTDAETDLDVFPPIRTETHHLTGSVSGTTLTLTAHSFEVSTPGGGPESCTLESPTTYTMTPPAID